MSKNKKLPWCHFDVLEDTETPLADKPVRVKYGNNLYMEICTSPEGIEVRMCGNVDSGTDCLTVIPVVSNVIRVLIAKVKANVR